MKVAPEGLLTATDRGVLEVYCVARSFYIEARENMGQGLVVKSPTKGEPMQNPYLPIVNRQGEIMMKAAAALGFDPTARARVGIQPGPAQKPGGSRFSGRPPAGVSPAPRDRSQIRRVK